MLGENVIICFRFVPDSKKNLASYSGLDDFLRMKKNLPREFHVETPVTRR